MARSRKPAALVPVSPAPVSVFEARPDLKEAVRDYVHASEADNTVRARRADWKVFSEWCERESVLPMPATPETVAAFLSDQSRGAGDRVPKAVATIVRYSRSIHAMHRLVGHESPVASEAVRLVLRGIRRERGTRQNQKAALTAERVAAALDAYEATLVDRPLQRLRDRVVVLLGLASGMRRAELCALDVEDLHVVAEGLVVEIRRSKTDQEGEGRVVAVPRLDESESRFCAVRAVEEWLSTIERATGPLLSGLKRNGEPKATYLSPGTVADIVKDVARSGGLDPDSFAAHSMRAGFVTTARERGVDWGAIMEQTGHKRLETVKLYTRYTPDVFTTTRVADVFKKAFKK